MSDSYVGPMSERIPVTHNGVEVRNWLLTSAGNVYLLSSIGTDCEFESEAESEHGYLDSLDVWRADPEIEATVLKAVREHALKSQPLPADTSTISTEDASAGASTQEAP